MQVADTERGFTRIEFTDTYGVGCSLQKSSLATDDCIWLGCNDAEPKQLIHGEGWKAVPMPKEYIANTRMHLTRNQVDELLPYLKAFVETGDLKPTEEKPAGPIFAGTMQGVANYLERLDRNAFTALRRAYEADGWASKTAQRYAIEYLQIQWCNIGDAWRIAQKLVD